MCAKSLILGFAMMIYFLPAGSYAQSHTATNSLENIDTSVIPDGSIVIISQEDADTLGYFRTNYAYVDRLCGASLIDHHGPPVDPNDKSLQWMEKRFCFELAMNTRDGE